MKRVLFSIFLFFIIKFSPGQIDSLSYSRIIFYRVSASYGTALSSPIYLDNQHIVDLKNEKYYEYFALPGSYVLSDSKKSPYKTEIVLDGGKTYYIKVFLMSGIGRAYAQFSIVDKQEAAVDLALLTHQGDNIELPGVPETQKFLRNSFGLQFSIGSGFSFIKTDESPEGDDISIGYGSSMIIGGSYSYQLNRKYAVGFAASYSWSKNTPDVDNYKAIFSHYDLELTLKYHIPISEFYSLSIGIGPQVSLFPKFIEQSNRETQLEISYKHAFGGLLETNFAFKASENLILFTGLRTQIREYQMDKVVKGSISNQQLKNPSGNSALVNFGVIIRL